MLTKKFDTSFDTKSFPGGRIPPSLMTASPTTLSVGDALFLLGGLTTPAGGSIASPMRFWAWLRYFGAIAGTPEFRVTQAFTELDPHQKSVLSDDFGVALTMQWLIDKLGTVSEVVDGRKFLVQFSSLLRRPPRKYPAKVGGNKCPDFVVLDGSGKWHVVECKGTQSSRNYLRTQLRTAVSQKSAISISGSHRGHALAAGAFLAGEKSEFDSELRIVDPEAEPFIIVHESDDSAAKVAAQRLTVARALTLSGFDQLGDLVSIPTREIEGLDFLTFEEKVRVVAPIDARREEARMASDVSRKTEFSIGGERFVGEEILVTIPGDSFRQNTGKTRVSVKRGIRMESIDRLLTDAEVETSADLVADEFLKVDRVQLLSDEGSAVFKQGELFAASIEFV